MYEYNPYLEKVELFYKNLVVREFLKLQDKEEIEESEFFERCKKRYFI